MGKKIKTNRKKHSSEKRSYGLRKGKKEGTSKTKG